MNKISYPVWHPYMNINSGYQKLINISEGKGMYLYDINGKEFLDATSGLWNVSLGYSNHAITNSIAEQMYKLPYCSLFEYTNQTAILAAQKILSLFAPTYKKVFFTCSGSESIELAVKLMRKYWNLRKKDKKFTILTLNNSYHGTYYASLTASALEKDLLRGYGPMVPDFYSLQTGICEECEAESCDHRCMSEIENYVQKNYESIAGIIIEPILASGGVKIPGGEFLESLCKLCSMYEIVITIDEVATGFFRTGTAFYFQQLKINPDLVCLSKGINSGYLPQGAVVIGESIADEFSNTSDILIHGSTQNGNLMSCAATIAAIDEYVKNNIEENVRVMGEYMKEQLFLRLSKHENVKGVRGVGLMLAIELMQRGNRRGEMLSRAIIELQQMLLQKGLIVYRLDVGLTLLPMLNIEKGQADYMIQTIFEVFSEILI